MRNLKKILSLALALMMILSVTASAAFTDAAKIDADYAEAVAVLNGMEVFQGYEDGSFQPTKAITRAEVAAIIYRIDTKDVEDDDVALYVDSANFSDVKAADWFSGYVGYCANAGYIKGYPDGTFLPNKTVTGFEALAMILRAMGYDAENEFSGAAWSQNIAKIASKAGILDVVKPGQLSLAGNREMIAQLLFDAIQAKTVKFYPAWGYLENATSIGDTFKLTKVTGTTDDWGRPGYKWTYTTGDEKTSFSIEPEAKYYTAVTECEVFEAAGFDGTSATVALWVNGSLTKDTIHALDTIDTIGAQGRLTEVYEDRIVMIDTFLAKVTDVTDATYDARGHRKSDSRIDLMIYDNDVALDKNGTAYYATNGKYNYDYEAGDMILVNVKANLTPSLIEARDTTGSILATNGLLAKLSILGLAKSEVGTQSVVWYNAKQHTVNGTTYPDAAEFHLNGAGVEITNHTWYFDQYGNIIGVADIDTPYGYAVLKNIWWSGDATTGAGKAMGTLVYMDGTENVVVIDELQGMTPKYSYTNVMTSSSDGKYIYVATNAGTNSDLEVKTQDFIKGHLFQVTTFADGAVALDKVTDEFTTTYMVNKYAYIHATVGADKTPVYVPINANTQFLYRADSETASFKTATGMNELPTFKAGATIDVVYSNGVAEYVYIIGAVESAYDSNFILVTGNTYGATLKTSSNGISYYEVTLVVPYEGTVTLKIKADNFALVKKLTTVDGNSKLFYVSYKDGYADSAVEIGGLNVDNPYTYDGGDNYAIKLTGASYSGNVIAASGWRFNVTEATVVYGDLSSLTNKVVYAIFDATNHNCSKVYVCEIDATQAPTDPDIYPVDPNKGTIAFTMTVKNSYTGAVIETVDMGYVKMVKGTYEFAMDLNAKKVVINNGSVALDDDARVVLANTTGLSTGYSSAAATVKVADADLGASKTVNFTVYATPAQ